MSELPEDVQRLLHRDSNVEYTPPSFERWLGRLQMLRAVAAMGAFLVVWLLTYSGGLGWEQATVRGIIAGIAFHFFAWAVGLLVFGELYEAEVGRARHTLEERERERARRIEEYYRERLQGSGTGQADVSHHAGGRSVPQLQTDLGTTTPLRTTPQAPPAPARRAA